MSTSGTLRQRGDMSDEEDEDAVVLFDFMHTVHERCASKLYYVSSCLEKRVGFLCVI